MSDINDPNNPKYRFLVSYDGYDYSQFWKGRAYEDQADKIAVSRLLSNIKGPRDAFIDIGAGRGRILPIYATQWKKIVLVDSSKHQLEEAKRSNTFNDTVDFIVATTEHIPFPAASFDAALCIRVFHYIFDPTNTIKEVGRILKPGGSLILEIPNKLHFKNRIKALLGINWREIFSAKPISKTTEGTMVFVNHHPKTILLLLKAHHFEVNEILSVSNFRFSFLKKILPFSVLGILERMAQKPLATVWFGPSIYFLAKKIENIEHA